MIGKIITVLEPQSFSQIPHLNTCTQIIKKINTLKSHLKEPNRYFLNFNILTRRICLNPKEWKIACLGLRNASVLSMAASLGPNEYNYFYGASLFFKGLILLHCLLELLKATMIHLGTITSTAFQRVLYKYHLEGRRKLKG